MPVKRESSPPPSLSFCSLRRGQGSRPCGGPGRTPTTGLMNHAVGSNAQNSPPEGGNTLRWKGGGIWTSLEALHGRPCKTKPICLVRPATCSWGHQKKRLTASLRTGARVRNKANSGRGELVVSAFAEKSYRRSHGTCGSEETKPICRPKQMVCMAPPTEGRWPRCAKQSQFAPSGPQGHP